MFCLCSCTLYAAIFLGWFRIKFSSNYEDFEVFFRHINYACGINIYLNIPHYQGK